ncbi:ferrous iron transport protein B [Cyclobacterium qasimii]|uniref:Ferrous iron transport protein B n=3 Tax=Bacteroidota TaxID=976 RepID=S7WLG1_9BACT|nr:ferrous iron transport protein B [Cyclobacterium qasimii]EPR67574.1 Ferrous iron transport protein B [Cyclobacterium qasimii M12-11B]GEO20928.1 ferrous iron transport protein B [Cyclobacterium qasimii]
MEIAEKLGTRRIAIIGNPNVGKSSIFNQLTGLSQKIGNYPGMTVDKMVGYFQSGEQRFELIDLPGTYSLLPKSEDEVIAHKVLNGQGEEKPDAALVILDACNLERSLLLGTQVMDLGIPIAFVINMKDLAEKRGLNIKTFALYQELGVPLVMTDARNNQGLDTVKSLFLEDKFVVGKPFHELEFPELLGEVQEKFGFSQPYQAFQQLIFASFDPTLSEEKRMWLEERASAFHFDNQEQQTKETTDRYRKIKELLSKSVLSGTNEPRKFHGKLDAIFLHPIWGYVTFFGIMLLIFQAIFAWAEAPMDFIDSTFASLSSWVVETLPPGVFTDLLAEGIITGIGGVVIFIPQIALLFGFLAFLEDTGYFSRVVFLMDRIMRPFGLHGKSVVPLISGMACAIPGIMASRNISNSKERLITILVTPWMSCSARLPVYVILIGLTVPDEAWMGINFQAIALLVMYLFGTVFTLLGAFALKFIIKTKEKSFLMTDLPIYRMPRLRTVLMTMFNKSKIFVLEAGKVILAISIVLWVLASYGPSGRMEAVEAEKIAMLEKATDSEKEEIMHVYASKELESSYIGILGKSIEPAIRPLGYDWKIGIALLTSFAAREVFVATVATIYSVGEEVEDELTIRQKLEKQVHADTGEKVFDRATGFSLMVFYALAMQCMSTVAVVYRETKSWKWPVLQTIFMTIIAYLGALATYQIFS